MSEQNTETPTNDLKFLDFEQPISELEAKIEELRKVGHDTEKDVVTKMGQPFRRTTDAQGRAVLTYVWADGKGHGEKCVIAFNKNGLVYVVGGPGGIRCVLQGCFNAVP